MVFNKKRDSHLLKLPLMLPLVLYNHENEQVKAFWMEEHHISIAPCLHVCLGVRLHIW